VSAQRTVQDIIDGHAHGVCGTVTNIKRGRLINKWFPTVFVRLINSRGLRTCACGEPGPPHCWIELAHAPCSHEFLDGLYDDISDRLQYTNVQIVGDVVTALEGKKAFPCPVVSGFVLTDRMSRNMTVPNRDIAISNHCAVCPLIVGESTV
jgi:hypothetical protein